MGDLSPHFDRKEFTPIAGCGIAVHHGIRGCWLWKGATNSRGYGTVSKWAARPRTRYAHRLMWEQVNGPIPEGLFVLHRCDTPRCVNPEHLFLGTYMDNSRDCRDKGRSAHGSKHGQSKLTEAQVAEIRRRIGTERATDLAREFGVSKPTMTGITKGYRWRHVPWET